jgi:2-phosphosulfolactate phosphatase
MAGLENTVTAVYAAGERGAWERAREGAAVVVVDAFRANTTLAVLVSKGVRVIPVSSVEEAATYTRVDYRVGEQGSIRVRGFDFGNSPAELVPGAEMVLSTTNGTRIIGAAHGASVILASAFVSAHAVADELATGTWGMRVAVIGCGREGRRSGEDEYAAGAILHLLREKGARLDEQTERVVGLYLARPQKSLLRNSAARRLIRLGYEKDLDFCPAENAVPVIPFLKGGAFIDHR